MIYGNVNWYKEHLRTIIIISVIKEHLIKLKISGQFVSRIV